MTTRGRENMLLPQACFRKFSSILAVTSKSAITPSFSGRTATMLPGVRPMTALASPPTQRTSSVLVSTATTEGSRMMIPLPFIYTRVLAVPRSMPISLDKKLIAQRSPFSLLGSAAPLLIQTPA